MKEYLTSVTRKGQITVPIEVRRALGLQEGDKVAVSLADENTQQAALRPVRSVAEMTYGALSTDAEPLDVRAMRQIFIDELVDRQIALREPAEREQHERRG